MADTQKKILESGVATLPIEWLVNVDTPTIYANNLMVQYGEHEAYLLFFESMPPLLVGSPEEVMAKLENIKAQAKCVSRVVVARELVPKIISALQSTQEKVRILDDSVRGLGIALPNSSLVPSGE